MIGSAALCSHWLEYQTIKQFCQRSLCDGPKARNAFYCLSCLKFLWISQEKIRPIHKTVMLHLHDFIIIAHSSKATIKVEICHSIEKCRSDLSSHTCLADNGIAVQLTSENHFLMQSHYLIRRWHFDCITQKKLYIKQLCKCSTSGSSCRIISFLHHSKFAKAGSNLILVQNNIFWIDFNVFRKLKTIYLHNKQSCQWSFCSNTRVTVYVLPQLCSILPQTLHVYGCLQLSVG